MQRGKSDIQKQRPKLRVKEMRIRLKKLTAENILLLNKTVNQKEAEWKKAVEDLQNHVLPLLTENGLKPGCRVVEVTEKEPYELVVMIPK